MADPLSIAASIAGLIGITTGLIKLCNDVRSSLKEEPAELLLNISKDIELLRTILSYLNVWNKHQVEDYDAGSLGDDQLLDLSPFIHRCKETINMIGDQILTFEKVAKLKGLNKLVSIFTFKERLKQLEALREDLKSSKATLLLSLTVSERCGLKLRTLNSSSNQSDISEPLSRISDKLTSISDVCNGILQSGSSKSETIPSISVNKYQGPNSFSEWLDSFASQNSDVELSEYRQKKRLQRNGNKSQIGDIPAILADPSDPQKVRLEIKQLRKKNGQKSTETLWVHRSMPVADLIRELEDQGYGDIHGLEAEDSEIRIGPTILNAEPFLIRVTSGSSSYDTTEGLRINKHECPTDFFNKLIENKNSREFLMIPPTEVSIESQQFCQGLEIIDKSVYWKGSRTHSTALDFRRCLRLPDDGNIYKETKDYGTLPLFKMADFAERLPAPFLAKGGYFISLFQREALSIIFENNSNFLWSSVEDFAMRVFVGSTNVVSGLLPESCANSNRSDYLTIPKQGRLDGFRISDQTARQFVGMPLSWGYSLEKQLTGSEFIGGIQLSVAAKLDVVPQFHRVCYTDGGVDKNIDISKSISELQLEDQFIQMSLYFRNYSYQQWRADFVDTDDIRDTHYTTRPKHPSLAVPLARTARVDDLILRLASAPNYNPEGTYTLVPVKSISFTIKIHLWIYDSSQVSKKNFNPKTTFIADTRTKTFQPYLDIQDFYLAISALDTSRWSNPSGKYIYTEMAPDKVEVNGNNMKMIRLAYKHRSYTPIIEVDTIYNGGVVDIFVQCFERLNTYRPPQDTTISLGEDDRYELRWCVDPELKAFIQFDEIVRSKLHPRSLGLEKGGGYDNDSEEERAEEERAEEEEEEEGNEEDYGAKFPLKGESSRYNFYPSSGATFELGLGIQGMLRQQILRSSENTFWDWPNATFVNIQILNAAIFQHITGIKAISPVPLRLLDRERLNEIVGNEDFAEISAVNLNTISDIDSKAPASIDLRISGGKKIVGCACCEVNLSDTILQPCHHVFCTECISLTMKNQSNDVICDACGTLSTRLIPFSSTMEMPTARVSTGTSNKSLDPDVVYVLDPSSKIELAKIMGRFEKFLPESSQSDFTTHIVLLSHNRELFEQEVRQLKHLPLGARALLLSEFLQSSSKWERFQGIYKGPRGPLDVYRPPEIRGSRSRKMVKLMLTLVPNVDDMCRDGSIARISDIFNPSDCFPDRPTAFFHTLKAIYTWVTSGSTPFSELGVSVAELEQLVISHGERSLYPLIEEMNEKVGLVSTNLAAELSKPVIRLEPTRDQLEQFYGLFY